MPNVFSYEVTTRHGPVRALVMCRERSETRDNATGPVLALVAMDEERMVARVGDDPHDLGEISHRDGLAVLVRGDGDPVVFDPRGSQPRRCVPVKLRCNERDNGSELHAHEEWQIRLVGKRAAENASSDDAEVVWSPLSVGDAGPLSSALCEPLNRTLQGVLLPEEDVSLHTDCVVPVARPLLVEM